MTRSPWHSYGIGAVICFVIATGSFLHHRNNSFVDRETSRAEHAARAVADGQQPVDAVVVAELVSRPEASQRYEFLRVRRAAGRRLGGQQPGPHDKLLYDSANRAERDGAFSEFLPGSDMIVAALPTSEGVAVAVLVPPTGPESFPWLVVLGLLTMGALVTSVGAMLGGASRGFGIFIGSSGLAVPTFIWAGLPAAMAIVAAAALVSVAELRGWTSRAVDELRRGGVAYAFMAPTTLAMLVLVFVPFTVGIFLGFYNHASGEWTYVGLDNFQQILSGGGRSLSDPLNFWFTLGVTLTWTLANVALHVCIGIALALVLRQTWIGGRNVFRVLLILPWAVPNYITALMWRGMFQGEYGALNGILDACGLEKVSWFSSWSTAFTANLCTNVWLGFPFMMVVALGALESIPKDLYEAAEVDGASPWRRFRHITVPYLRATMAPAIALGAIWTFNMFNVIYLVSSGQPGYSTDILVTEAYRWAFERGERYGLATAYATIIFLILLLWSVIGTRIARREPS